MCGRYASAKSIDVLAGHFRAAAADDVEPPGYNVAPTDRVPVVIERDGRRCITGMRWGLVPSWSPDGSGGARMINARIETVADKPAFRTALARRRALVPADAYYEWLSRPGVRKQPHAIGMRDRGILAFAGLWERWRSPTGEDVLSCTIVTRAAAGGIAYLHDRMPVVVPPQLWDDWLDPHQQETSAAVTVLDLAGIPDLTAYPVGQRVGDVRATGPELLDPVDPVDPVDLPPAAEQLDLLA